MASYKNVSYVDQFYSPQGTSLGWTHISISCTGHVTGGQSSPTLYIHGNCQNDLINSKCMSIYSLGHKEQKSQLPEIHTTFRSPDRGQNNKRSLTFCTGVKFSSWSNFNENGLNLIGLSCRFRKCTVSYTLMSRIWSKEGSKFNDHKPQGPYIGICGH